MTASLPPRGLGLGRKPNPARRGWRACALALAALLLGACTTVRETQPDRTATEQLLISAAAERAIERLDLGIAPGTKVVIHAQNLDSYDEGYVISTLRDRLLREGIRTVSQEADADLIVEVRSGALSIDERSDLLGIPSFPVPIPLAGTFQTPEVALFKRERQEGVAKLAVTSYDPKSGALHSSSGPTFGSSTHDRWVVLIFGWTDEDIGREGRGVKLDKREPQGRGRGALP